MSRSNFPFKIFLLVLPFLWGCRSDDDSMMNPLSVCSDGGVYALDLASDVFRSNQIWLTEADGDIAADQEWDIATLGVQFFNFEDACEDAYTMSLAGYRQQEPGTISSDGENLWVREVAEVPNGSNINTRVLLQGTASAVTFMPGYTFEIQNCPAIDSVRFWLGADRNNGYGLEPDITLTYQDIENKCIIDVQQAVAYAGTALLAVRHAAYGTWFGTTVNLFGQVSVDLDFFEMPALETKPINISWQDGLEDLFVEIRWINEIGSKRSMVLDVIDKEGDFVVPMPAEAQGPFTIYARQWSTGTREVQQVFDTWPSEVDINFQLEGEVTNFTYPELQYEASGANIAVANGIYSGSPNSVENSQRWYAGPAAEGQQSITFAPLSFVLRDSRTEFLYDQAYKANARLKLYNYANMNSDYSWYLRNVYSDLGTGDHWLKTLDYEMLIVGF